MISPSLIKYTDWEPRRTPTKWTGILQASEKSVLKFYKLSEEKTRAGHQWRSRGVEAEGRRSSPPCWAAIVRRSAPRHRDAQLESCHSLSGLKDQAGLPSYALGVTPRCPLEGVAAEVWSGTNRANPKDQGCCGAAGLQAQEM